MTIDLNCDMGELPEDIENGRQEALMAHVTSVNIACGAHAGDPETMRQTVRQALRWKLAIGAHPGYPDRGNFGRKAMALPPDTVAECVYEQVRTLAGMVALTHVKPHGALYNQAAQDAELAAAIARGIARVSPALVLVGLAGSAMLSVFRDAGFPVAAEAFADRRYEADGTLRARRHSDALLTDPAEAAEQAARIVLEKRVIAWDGRVVPIEADTLCIHGDSPHAPAVAAAVARRLDEAGVLLRPLGS